MLFEKIVAGNAARTKWLHSTANSSVNFLFYCQ